MYPEIFRIPVVNWPVHSYGLMLVVGLLLAIELAKYLARRSGFNPDQFANAGILALVSGIVGARVLYVIQFNEEFRDPAKTFLQNAGSALNITSGGLVYYGGFLLAFPTLVIYAYKSKIPVRRGMDIIAPCLMIGLAFGRVGCLLNGCCGGSTCDLPWALRFPYNSETYNAQFAHDETRAELNVPAELIQERDDGRISLRQPLTLEQKNAALSAKSLPVHPTQIYSFITAGLIAVVSYFCFTLRLPAGRGFALMMMLEGMSRGMIETLRTEPIVGGYGITLSMWIGAAVFAGGLALWFLFSSPQTGGTPADGTLALA